MEMTPLMICIVIAFGILTTATSVTFLLLKKSPANHTLLKVMTIVKSWWIIVAFFLGALCLGRWGVLVLFFGVNVLTLREYLKHSQLPFKKALGILLLAAIVLQYLMLMSGSLTLFMAFPALVIPVIVPIVVILTNSVVTLPFVFSTTLGMLLMIHFMSYLPALAWLRRDMWPSADQELLAIGFLFLLTEANDILQFLSGKMFGKRKLLPMISPNKTEAGFIGGLILTPALASITLVPLVGLTLPSALVIGFAVSFVGILGDLMFSTIKRYFGTKDFSDALPGHGGVLDRMDSLVLTAPVYFHLLMYFKEFPL